MRHSSPTSTHRRFVQRALTIHVNPSCTTEGTTYCIVNRPRAQEILNCIWIVTDVPLKGCKTSAISRIHTPNSTLPETRSTRDARLLLRLSRYAMEHIQSLTSQCEEVSAGSGSRLLSLPAELRVAIFTFLLGDVRCRRPLVVWDGVCVGTSGSTHPVETAILQACRTTYNDATPILYEQTAVDISIRADTLDDSFPRFQTCLGPITDCPLLQKLRHIRLEIAYRCDLGTIARVRDRVYQLANACNKLKTIDLVFFDQSAASFVRSTKPSNYADVIVKASMNLKCHKFVDIRRNLAAKKGMDPVNWHALQDRLNANDDATTNDMQETFSELSFSYFEHEFRLKN